MHEKRGKNCNRGISDKKRYHQKNDIKIKNKKKQRCKTYKSGPVDDFLIIDLFLQRA